MNAPIFNTTVSETSLIVTWTFASLSLASIILAGFSFSAYFINFREMLKKKIFPLPHAIVCSLFCFNVLISVGHLTLSTSSGTDNICQNSAGFYQFGLLGTIMGMNLHVSLFSLLTTSLSLSLSPPLSLSAPLPLSLSRMFHPCSCFFFVFVPQVTLVTVSSACCRVFD